MGVYIKGMKMPKECGECPLYSSIDDVCQFDQTDTCYDKKRPLWCPLVEVSEPHGDLIDRQKLLEDNKHLEYPTNELYRRYRA